MRWLLLVAVHAKAKVGGCEEGEKGGKTAKKLNKAASSLSELLYLGRAQVIVPLDR